MWQEVAARAAARPDGRRHRRRGASPAPPLVRPRRHAHGGKAEEPARPPARRGPRALRAAGRRGRGARRPASADQVDVLRGADGVVEVRMATEGQERFHRRFRPDETDEVRIYLKGGDDRARSHGGNGPIEVRVVGGPGADTLDDSRGGHPPSTTTRARTASWTGRSTEESDKPYETPRDRQGNALRDWGSHGAQDPVAVGGRRPRRFPGRRPPVHRLRLPQAPVRQPAGRARRAMPRAPVA